MYIPLTTTYVCLLVIRPGYDAQKIGISIFSYLHYKHKHYMRLVGRLFFLCLNGRVDVEINPL